MLTQKQYCVRDKDTKQCIYGYYHTKEGAVMRKADLEIQDREDGLTLGNYYEVAKYNKETGMYEISI